MTDDIAGVNMARLDNDGRHRRCGHCPVLQFQRSHLGNYSDYAPSSVKVGVPESVEHDMETS